MTKNNPKILTHFLARKVFVQTLANTFVANTEAFRNILAEKAKIRCIDESIKPLAAYRQFELTQVYANFYSNDAYHLARQKFVFKNGDIKQTPSNIAKHRQTTSLPN